KHWFWIAEYYMCTIGEVFKAAVPNAFLLGSETIIHRNDRFDPENNPLKKDETQLYALLQQQAVLKVNEISKTINRKNVLPLLERALKKQLIHIKEELTEPYRPKLIKHLRLHSRFTSDVALQHLLDQLSRAPKQREAVLTLFSLAATKKHVKTKTVRERANVSATTIKSLLDKEILEEYTLQTDRIQYSETVTESPRTLNSHQQSALEDIKEAFKTHHTVLLHGVTSSGKTELYVKLMEEQMATNPHKQILYLLPEIAITQQLIGRLQRYFGQKIRVYHSRYSASERVELWNNCLKNTSKSQIIIGTRSALFLPFPALGLIIVDEEHETSFKQFDPAPRYHARDSAVVLAGLHGAKVLLGSATPAIESYYNTKIGKYGLATIKERYGSVQLPEITLVNLREKHRKKQMKGHFSDRLVTAIQKALAADEQVILFQNRRGYAPILTCNVCGHSPQCIHCDVSLTYHKHNNQLRCHYCGYHIALQQTCLACGSTDLDTKGFGTEQIETELKHLFPDGKVARMDLDTTRGKLGYEKIISAFEQQEIHILVGTQMLTKGLDFNNVSLVGIMNADALFNFPDFRAHERSFQLLLQVAGRAGRRAKQGQVIIQTYTPGHSILQQVMANDYEGMYESQLSERQHYRYPPFFRLIKITLKHKNYNNVNESAEWMARSLRNTFGDYVL
ncbi:MAG: primosomal protein N', partial [Bacteroidota bacterium]